MEGWLTTTWATIQTRYYQQTGNRRNGLRWTVAIIKKLWDIVWDLWEQWNDLLHARENQESLHNMVAIDEEIKQLATLPWRTHYLFGGTVAELLATPIRHRKKWLATVQSARTHDITRQERKYTSLDASRRLM